MPWRCLLPLKEKQADSNAGKTGNKQLKLLHMKICLVQTRSVKGNIEANITAHLHFIELALLKGAGMIVFPELSITGYEPGLASALAVSTEDARFNQFQQISNRHTVIIAIGVPVRINNGVSIGLLIFRPGREKTLYSKKYLHPDELPFFAGAENFSVLGGTDPLTAFAICYEISVPAHAARAAAGGAAIYIASVAKTATGMDKASQAMAAIAEKYSMTALLVNCTGHCDNFESAGRSAVWNSKGMLMAQLDSEQEGILLYNNKTGEVSIETA